MLKDKKFWHEVENTINEEHSDYVVLDMYFAMRTYRVLTDDELSQLPVQFSRFYYIYNRCRNKAIDLLEYKFAEYISELESITADIPKVGVASSVIKVIAFIRKHKEPLALFCAMGVLTGIEDCTTDASSLCVLQTARNALFNVIVSL